MFKLCEEKRGISVAVCLFPASKNVVILNCVFPYELIFFRGGDLFFAFE